MSWNSTFKPRKTSLRDSYAKKLREQPAKERKPAFKKGPKVKQWDADRAKLKVAFFRAGITRCELGYTGCMGNAFLTFAHSKKRRFVITKDDREEVALACQNCHNVIEHKSHVVMQGIVTLIILGRDTPVASIF